MSKYSLIILCSLILLTPQTAYAEVKIASLEPVKDKLVSQEIVVDAAIFEDKEQVLKRVVQTLKFLQTPEARALYTRNFANDFTIERVQESLLQFYFVFLFSRDLPMLQSRLAEMFSLYRSVGIDGQGTVKFTGYFQPVYKAARQSSPEFSYPIFKKPADFDHWDRELHPKRIQLEGFDGLGGNGTILEGQEIAYLSSRFDVFMIQLQGSAILEFQDGHRTAVGFVAGTNYPFKGGIDSSFMRRHNVAWHKLGDFFNNKKALLDEIMSRNNRFIFFEERSSPEAVGNLGVPVLAGRSIATDNLQLPPGAVGIIRTNIPVEQPDGSMQMRRQSRFVLNLDTGSAIKGAGRVDLFMGTGESARRKASSIYGTGELYYLFLKN